MSRKRPNDRNILLIDDGSPDLEVLTQILTRHQYDVQTALASELSGTMFDDSTPSAILVGADRSESERNSILERLRENPATQDVPVLLIDPEDRGSAFGPGGAEHVLRPFVEAEILARLETQISLQPLRGQLRETQRQLKRATAHAAEVEAERDAAYKALEEAEASGRDLIENLRDVIYAFDPEGYLTYVSPAIEAFLGYHPSEVIGSHFSVFILPEDLPRLQANFQRLLSGNEAANEYRVLTKSGEVRWMRTSSQPTFEGEQVVGIQGVLADITEQKQAEQTLREQNHFLTQVLESLTHPFCVVDANDYTIHIANSAASREAQLGRITCYALTHGRSEPCSTADHPCPVAEIKKTKRPVTVEHVHEGQGGETRYVEVHGFPLFDNTGAVVRVIEYTLDVTARHQAEEGQRLALAEARRTADAWQASEKRYRQLLDALQEGIWVIDQDARTTFVNPRMAEMLGYSVEEMEGKSLFDFMDARGFAISKRNLERREQGIKEQHDFEFQRKDGSRMYAWLQASPIYDSDGNYVGAIAGIQDITERRRVEQALHRSETLLRETQRLSRVGGWELDLRTEEVAWTEEVYRIHELPFDFEPRLETALSFYAPEDRPKLERAIQRATTEGEPWDLELRFLTATGRRLWVRAIGRAEHEDGRAVKLAGTFQDITDRKAVEQALRKAKDDAVAARREERERRREAEQRRRIAESLADILAALNSDQALEEILDQIAVRAGELFGSRAVVFYRLAGSDGNPVIQAFQGPDRAMLDKLQTPPMQEALIEAVLSGRPVALPALGTSLQVGASSPSVPGLTTDGSGNDQFQGLLAVPIHLQGEAYGGVALYYGQPRSFSVEDNELAILFSNQASLAIENARLREQAERAAASAERSRLARDLHDSVTQALFSASLVAEILPRVWQRDPDEALDGLQKLRRLTRGALSEMRTMLLELRPAALMETRLNELLEQLTEAVIGRVQVQAVVDLEPIPALPPDVHVAFYRVAQEALNNVVKHAEASQVIVSLRASPPLVGDPAGQWQGQVILHVRDDGRGFEPDAVARGRLGLAFMRERARSVGAILTIDSQEGQGTQVSLVWQA